jgi:hypothetical protein
MLWGSIWLTIDQLLLGLTTEEESSEGAPANVLEIGSPNWR